MQILNKTQQFKSKILPLCDCESDVIISREFATVLCNQTEVEVSFTFDAYYLYDGWVAIKCYNYIVLPDDTENAEEIKNFIANNYCTDDEFSGYFSDRLDESECSG
jgi:hypothetical protein